MYKILSKKFDNKFSILSQQRPYAQYAIKFKFDKETMKEFSKEEMNNLNIHAQYVTDFNLIYEKEGEERVYVTAFLHTNKTKESFQISSDQNYSFENKPQNITFLKKPIEVTNDIHIFKKSNEFLDKPENKAIIESNDQHILLFQKVLDELNGLNITTRKAETPEEMDLTALNVLKRMHGLSYKNEKLETIVRK